MMARFQTQSGQMCDGVFHRPYVTNVMVVHFHRVTFGHVSLRIVLGGAPPVCRLRDRPAAVLVWVAPPAGHGRPRRGRDGRAVLQAAALAAELGGRFGRARKPHPPGRPAASPSTRPPPLVLCALRHAQRRCRTQRSRICVHTPGCPLPSYGADALKWHRSSAASGIAECQGGRHNRGEARG